ncbi:MAG: PEP-CTERM sorting domain-containing protein [Cellvibrio sp.]|uniref:PEP-CTERM sorting domain-containing protein n=1 Tax=Cellvibrio sp. TaxID=1965322 RepID=UPI0031B49D93
MKTNIVFKSFGFVLALTAMQANAVIIEGHFTGNIRSFENGTEDGTFAGYWENVSVGSVVTGSFWYDTSKAPANTSLNDYYAEYRSYTDEWMGSNFSVDGKTYYISDHVPLDRYVIKSEGLNLFDLETTPDYPYPARDIFYLFDNISSGGNGGGYKAVGLMVEVSNEDKTLLDGLGIIQEFDWYDIGDPTSYAQAYIDIGSSTSDEMRISNAWVDISEIHVRIKDTTSVAEPSTIYLLILAGLALTARRRLA